MAMIKHTQQASKVGHIASKQCFDNLAHAFLLYCMLRHSRANANNGCGGVRRCTDCTHNVGTA